MYSEIAIWQNILSPYEPFHTQLVRVFFFLFCIFSSKYLWYSFSLAPYQFTLMRGTSFASSWHQKDVRDDKLTFMLAIHTTTKNYIIWIQYLLSKSSQWIFFNAVICLQFSKCKKSYFDHFWGIRISNIRLLQNCQDFYFSNLKKKKFDFDQSSEKPANSSDAKKKMRIGLGFWKGLFKYWPFYVCIEH